MKDKNDLKKIKLSRAIGEVDEELIAKAAPKTGRKRPRWIGWVSLAACFTIVCSLGLWLFLPFGNTPPSVGRHANSAYFPIIQRLNAITYRGSSYENNFEMLFSGWLNGAKAEDGEMENPTSGAPTSLKIFSKFSQNLQPNAKKSYLWGERPFSTHKGGEQHG